MAEDRREDAFGIGARQGEFVGVADAGGLDLDQNLALFRVVEVHFHDLKRFAGGNGNGGTGAQVPPALPPDDACGAPGLQGLVGQPRRVLETMTFAGPVRVIEPGMAVTMDYSPNRLNIELDDEGTITRVTCG
jgi:hypothetical protein